MLQRAILMSADAAPSVAGVSKSVFRWIKHTDPLCLILEKLRHGDRARRSDHSSFTESSVAAGGQRGSGDACRRFAGGPPLVISKRSRERLIYLGMSLIVGWHGFAIIIAPSPDSSAIVQTLRPIVQPYLSLFRLDDKWNFFVPAGKFMHLRYVVEDAAGKQHLFIPAEDPSGSVARYAMWREFKYLYEGVMEIPEVRSEPFAALLCRKHAALDPVSISFLQVQELDFSPQDYLQGHRRFDPEFISVNTLATVKC
jgi:hypothetical protein